MRIFACASSIFLVSCFSKPAIGGGPFGDVRHVRWLYDLLAETQTTWYIDPANASTCASDSNTTCSLSTCGTPGDGPCKTFAQIAQRWGTYAPRLRQTTTFHSISSMTDNTDPIFLRPSLENGANLIWQCDNGVAQQTGTGMLAGVVAKNTATPQLLNATLGAGPAINQLVQNTTHPSFAWTYKVVSGTTFSLSQPLSSNAPTTFGSEVNTWANTDAFVAYNPIDVNFVDLEPLSLDQSGGQMYVYGCSAYSPRGVGLDPLVVNDNVWFNNALLKRQTSYVVNSGLEHGLNNTDDEGVFNALDSYTNLNVTGGQFVAASGYFMTYPNVANDTIFDGNGTLLGAFFTGNVYNETGKTIFIAPGGSGSGQLGALWGAGTLSIIGNQVWNYTAPASTAFPQATLQISEQSVACGHSNASTDVQNCNITITKAHLDAAQGAAGFGGTAYVPGGAAISSSFF